MSGFGARSEVNNPGGFRFSIGCWLLTTYHQALTTIQDPSSFIFDFLGAGFGVLKRQNNSDAVLVMVVADGK